MLLLTLLFFSLKTWYDYTPYQKQAALIYFIAGFKTGVPFGDVAKQNQTYIHEDGSQQRARSVDIPDHPWMQQQISFIKNKFHGTLLHTGLFFIFTFLSILGFLVWQGKAKAEKEILSGTIEVPQKELVKLIQRGNTASNFELSGLLLLKDSETKHLLLAGTTGSGKTNTFNQLLPQIRKLNQRAAIVDITRVFVEKFYNPQTGIILNLLDVQSKNWDIWQECQNDLYVDELVTSLIPSTLHDPFWPGATRSLFGETLKILKKEKDHF